MWERYKHVIVLILSECEYGVSHSMRSQFQLSDSAKLLIVVVAENTGLRER